MSLRKPVRIVFTLIAASVGLSLAVWLNYPRINALLVQKSSLAGQSKITVTPTPTSVPITLPKGKQVYEFSHGDNVVGPKPSTMTIDPLIAGPDEKQTVRLKAAHTAPITAVTIYVTTDTKQEVKHELKRITGSSTDGEWEGSWTLNDTAATRYAFRLLLKSSQGNYNNTMKFRD